MKIIFAMLGSGLLMVSASAFLYDLKVGLSVTGFLLILVSVFAISNVGRWP